MAQRSESYLENKRNREAGCILETSCSKEMKGLNREVWGLHRVVVGITELLPSPTSPAKELVPPWDPERIPSQCSAYTSPSWSAEGKPSSPPIIETWGEREKHSASHPPPPTYYLETILNEEIAMAYFTAVQKYVLGVLENRHNTVLRG